MVEQEYATFPKLQDQSSTMKTILCLTQDIFSKKFVNDVQ